MKGSSEKQWRPDGQTDGDKNSQMDRIMEAGTVRWTDHWRQGQSDLQNNGDRDS